MDKYSRTLLEELNKKGIRKVSILAGYFGKNQTMLRWSNKTHRVLRDKGVSGTVQHLAMDKLATDAKVGSLLNVKNQVVLIRVNTTTGSVSTASGNHPFTPRWVSLRK